ncbi:I17RC protein, partial [Ceuthmochares aereus]|nr:I17RC protein [Ceuthmochares aereus]
DAEAWERLWARSQLVLHAEGQALTCSLSAPCDLPAELVPCWQPAPAGPCQALPGLQQPAMGQGPQEFRGLHPHPSLCVQVGHSSAPCLPHRQPQALLTYSLGQVRSGGQVRLTQCLRDREYCWGLRAGSAQGSGGEHPLASPCCPSQPSAASLGGLPGRTDDLLLLERGEHGGNTSLCALERGTCTPLAGFASVVRGRDPRDPAVVTPVAQWSHPLPLLQGAGHPGLLEEELRQDVAMGQCRQVSAGSCRAVGTDRAACDMSPSPQIWHPENGTGVTLWACPLHKYLHTRWALAWMGVLLGAACLILLLLLKKEDAKG